MEGHLQTRSVLSLMGEDAAAFLQGLVTQDVTGAGPVFSALLTPQGKILFDFFLIPVEREFIIDCDAGAAPALLKRLQMYKLRAKIALSAAEGFGVFLGARAGARATYADPRHPLLPMRTIAPRAEAPAADEAYDGVRLAAGVPEFGRDFAGEEVFLLDVNYDVLAGVSYKKGCFVGQEVTSRMKRKGEIRKRSLIVRGTALSKGAPVTAEGTALGAVTSHRGEAGLALIRIDRLAEARAAGAAILCGGATAALEAPAYLKDG
ncbi:MAG: YgfZ/GcvT domain-containing protein [Parvularculaceae bacterium]